MFKSVKPIGKIKTIMKAFFLCTLLLSLSIMSLGQKNTYQKKLPEQIKKNIRFAGRFVYAENPDYNIDSLCKVTANKVVSLMAGNNYSSIYYQSLGLKLSAERKDKTNIKIYNFGYDCGGTRRIITHPIIQWKNGSGKTFAYNLSSKINCNFFEIHQLKSQSRNLYLLIGQEAGDGNCYQGIAYVIEIKGNYLIVNHPMFDNRPYLNLCNREFEFDTKTQILTGLLTNPSFPSGEQNIFHLKFNGHQFVKYDKTERKTAHLELNFTEISRNDFQSYQAKYKTSCILDSGEFISGSNLCVVQEGKEICETYLAEGNTNKKMLMPSSYDAGILKMLLSPSCNQLLVCSSYDGPDYGNYYDYRAEIFLFNVSTGIGLKGITPGLNYHTKDWSIHNLTWVDEHTIALELYNETRRDKEENLKFRYFKSKLNAE